MKALITGCGGFIGSHLAGFLLEKGFDVYGTVHVNTKNVEHLKEKIHIVRCDVTKKDEVDRLVREVKPDYVFHLAAQSFVTESWKRPEDTLNANVFGTFNLLDSIRNAGIDPVVFVACSSAEYGLNYEDEIPIKEGKEFRPSSPYAVSKIATDMLSYLYWQAFKMKIFRIRFFNITGVRKTGDACSDFAKGIVEVEKGVKNSLKTGNLAAVRDFTDVRDALRALWAISEKGKYGDVYNICSGNRYKVSELLDILVSNAKTEVAVIHDEGKLRILDDPVFVGDNTKLGKLGWKAHIPIEKTLCDMLDYWRNEIKA